MTPSRTSGPRALRGALPVAIATSVLTLWSAAAAAAPKIPKVSVGIEKCIPTVLVKHPGTVLQVVLKPEDGKPVWEIEVDGKDGKLWDVECSGATGKIVESEQRFKSADEPGFKEKVKVSETDATKTALAKHPGKVERVEYEVEADGTPVYEFDIEQDNGDDVRVEVDAVTGKLREAHPELLEIGRLPK
ncbi:PepSY domain-containing protein [Methylibium petroleiphilum]|uniref:PepSY domain-containing protein n=1 Tax=Methylibium petroleiphilum TaxID=105560 RepID=UPI003D27886B